VSPGERVPPAGERRRIARPRALLRGLFVFEQPAITVECTIRDLTQFGARVVVPPGVVVPRQGWLIDIRDGRAHDTSVVWRASGLLGVSFGETVNLRSLDLGRRRRLRQLWLACGG